MKCSLSLYIWVLAILKAPCHFLSEALHTLLEAFVFLKIAEQNVQNPLDERNDFKTDDLMRMSLHVDLHFMAPPFYGLPGQHL